MELFVLDPPTVCNTVGISRNHALFFETPLCRRGDVRPIDFQIAATYLKTPSPLFGGFSQT